MTVIPLKTINSCTICKHARRTDIDVLLERRSNRETLPNGVKINGEYVYRILREWGVYTNQVDMTIEAGLKNHWRKHVQKLDQEKKADEETQKKKDDAMALLARDPETMNVEAYLHRIIQIDAAETEARIAAGEKSGVTKDHALKAAQELSRRGANQAQGDLLKALAGGIAHAFGPAREQSQLPPAHAALPDGTPTVVDGEFHEVEEAFGE